MGSTGEIRQSSEFHLDLGKKKKKKMYLISYEEILVNAGKKNPHEEREKNQTHSIYIMKIWISALYRKTQLSIFSLKAPLSTNEIKL